VLVISIVLILPVCGAGINDAKGSLDPSNEWLEACQWLRSHTPYTGMDYNRIYDAPKSGETFQYPDTAYGVMSWWDYGDYIQIFGHRLPNANPFQEGIGGRRGSINEKNAPGLQHFSLHNQKKKQLQYSKL
jgi:asparagine N-glycosylation enzyme membrane subunit Stt3